MMAELIGSFLLSMTVCLLCINMHHRRELRHAHFGTRENGQRADIRQIFLQPLRFTAHSKCGVYVVYA